MDKQMQKFLSVPEIRDILGISSSRAYDLVRSAGFPSLRVGRRIVVDRPLFEAWIRQQLEKGVDNYGET
jgi:excisionase family DNA binding protein